MKPVRGRMSSTQAHIHPLHHKKGKKLLSSASPGNALRITECGSNLSINYTGIMDVVSCPVLLGLSLVTVVVRY